MTLSATAWPETGSQARDTVDMPPVQMECSIPRLSANIPPGLLARLPEPSAPTRLMLTQGQRARPPAAVRGPVPSGAKPATRRSLYEAAPTETQAAANRSAEVAEAAGWYSATVGTMVTNMQDGGGSAGTPADAGSWMSAHGVGT